MSFDISNSTVGETQNSIPTFTINHSTFDHTESSTMGAPGRTTQSKDSSQMAWHMILSVLLFGLSASLVAASAQFNVDESPSPRLDQRQRKTQVTAQLVQPSIVSIVESYPATKVCIKLGDLTNPVSHLGFTQR